jgi:hypothetical protein
LSSVSAAASTGFLPPGGVPWLRGERSALGDRRASASRRARVEAKDPDVEGKPGAPRVDAPGDAVDAIAFHALHRPARPARARRKPTEESPENLTRW